MRVNTKDVIVHIPSNIANVSDRGHGLQEWVRDYTKWRRIWIEEMCSSEVAVIFHRESQEYNNQIMEKIKS